MSLKPARWGNRPTMSHATAQLEMQNLVGVVLERFGSAPA